MTNEEAKYAIFSGIETNENINMGEEPYFEIMVLAEQALDKQIPNKPINVPDAFGDMWLRCSSCNNHSLAYLSGTKFNYCPNCGQKLEWEVEE